MHFIKRHFLKDTHYVLHIMHMVQRAGKNKISSLSIINVPYL